jgi:hypothetical protein
MPAKSLYIHSHLAAALFDLLTFATGRPFANKSAASADWSQLVWDILTTGLTNAFNRKNSGRANASRHAGASLNEIDGLTVASRPSRNTMSIASDALGSASATLLYQLDGLAAPPASGPEFDREDGGGVSIVLIETAEQEQGESRD